MAKAKHLKELMNKVFSTRVDDPIYTEHASHTFFDEFSDDYMSTGEGGQYYGKGHYTSTHPTTHESYKDQFRRHHKNELGTKAVSVDRNKFIKYLEDTDNDDIARAFVAEALDRINVPNGYSHIGDWTDKDLADFVNIVTDDSKVDEILDSMGYVTDDTVDYVRNMVGAVDTSMVKPENYAASMGVNLHLDPRRILEIDEVVDDEMLELLRGKGGTPGINRSSLPKDSPTRQWLEANDKVNVLNASYDKLEQETDLILEMYPETWWKHPLYKDISAKMQDINKERLQLYNSHINNRDLRDKYEAELKEMTGSVFPNDYFDRQEELSSGAHTLNDIPDQELKPGTPGFSPEEFRKSAKSHQRYDEPTNKNLVNYLDNEWATQEDPMAGQRLLKEIGLQASRHLDYGSRHGMTDKDYHNYITFYPELMEIVKKEKGNITLPMLATLAAGGAALPPAATKLVKEHNAKKAAKAFTASFATGIGTGTTRGLADAIEGLAKYALTGTPRKPEDTPRMTGAVKTLRELAEKLEKPAEDAGLLDKKIAQQLGELIAPGI